MEATGFPLIHVTWDLVCIWRRCEMVWSNSWLVAMKWNFYTVTNTRRWQYITLKRLGTRYLCTWIKAALYLLKWISQCKLLFIMVYISLWNSCNSWVRLLTYLLWLTVCYRLPGVFKFFAQYLKWIFGHIGLLIITMQYLYWCILTIIMPESAKTTWSVFRRPSAIVNKTASIDPIQPSKYLFFLLCIHIN